MKQIEVNCMLGVNAAKHSANKVAPTKLSKELKKEMEEENKRFVKRLKEIEERKQRERNNR